jgi:hypothetical protein
LWPLLVAPAVGLLGLGLGVIVVSLLGAMLAALAVYVALRLLGCSPIGACASGLAFSLLPTGFWSDKLLPEGAVFGTLVVATHAAARVAQGRPRHLPLLVVCLGALYAFKPANGAALAVGLVLVGALLLPISKGRRGALLLTAVGVVGIVGWLALSRILNLPSFEETLQDLATGHFSKPDSMRPYGVLWDRDLGLWTRDIDRWLGFPWPYALVLPAAAVVVYVLRRAGLVWAVVSMTGTLIVVAHPMITQYDRLVSSVWLAVTAAIAVLVDLVTKALLSTIGGAPRLALQPS